MRSVIPCKPPTNNRVKNTFTNIENCKKNEVYLSCNTYKNKDDRLLKRHVGAIPLTEHSRFYKTKITLKEPKGYLTTPLSVDLLLPSNRLSKIKYNRGGGNEVYRTLYKYPRRLGTYKPI